MNLILVINVRKGSMLTCLLFAFPMQPGAFDLVGTIMYEIDQHPYQSTFYNGTIEVVDASSILSMESIFLVTLGIALLVLFGLWIYGQVQNASKVLQFYFLRDFLEWT